MSYDRIVNPELELSLDHDFGAIQLLSNDFLRAVAKGKVDIKALLEYELAARGYDTEGNWTGLSPKSNEDKHHRLPSLHLTAKAALRW